MCIYGAVFTGAVCVVLCAFQPNNCPAMAELAGTLKALKMALCDLKNYYDSESVPQQAHTPFFHTYYDETQGKDVEIEEYRTMFIGVHPKQRMWL